MKKLLAAALMVVFAASAAIAAAPDTMVLKAKNGDVNFNHKQHGALGCKKCHATEQGGKIEGFGKDLAHKQCKGCHQEMKKGPTKCGECHKK